MRLIAKLRWLVCLLLCGGMFSPVVAQEGVAPALPDGWELQVENLTRLGMRFWRVPGCAVAVVHDGKVLMVRGFGTNSLNGKEAVTGDTVFPIASCTKSFTVTRLAQLVDQGKVGWDDPIVKYLPWFRLADAEATGKVTLRLAASHTGGVGGHDLLWYRWGGSLRERVERLAGVPVETKPGEKFTYQTSLFTALGLVEEAVDGRPWEEQIRVELLEPLGMGNTWADPGKIGSKLERAQPHRLTANDNPALCEGYPFAGPDPAGSIHSTARDMAKWVQFHLSDGTTSGGKRLVSAAQMDAMHTLQIAQTFSPTLRGLNPSAQGMGYGLGFTVYDQRGEKVLAHGGAVDGMRAQFSFVPGKKLGLVILCNMGLTRLNLSLTHHLLDLFLGHKGRDYNGLVFKQQRKDVVELLERARLAGEKATARAAAIDGGELEGIYVHPAYGEAKLFMRDGVPMFKLGATETRLRLVGPACWLAEAEPFGGASIEYLPGGRAKLRVSGEVNLELMRKP